MVRRIAIAFLIGCAYTNSEPAPDDKDWDGDDD